MLDVLLWLAIVAALACSFLAGALWEQFRLTRYVTALKVNFDESLRLHREYRDRAVAAIQFLQEALRGAGVDARPYEFERRREFN